MWLPVLGAALFLVVGVLWAVSALSHASKGDTAQPATVAASAPSAAAPTAAAPRPPAPPTTAAAASAPRPGLIRRPSVVAGQP
jgi:hypothetical protein